MKKHPTSDVEPITIEYFFLNLESARRADPERFRKLTSASNSDAFPAETPNLPWRGKGASLPTLFNLIDQDSLVDTGGWDNFQLHFTEGNSSNQKFILHEMQINEIAYIIKRFCQLRLIARYAHLHTMIQDHFLDQYEKPIKTGSLKTMISRGVRREDRVAFLDDIIEKVLKAHDEG